MPIAKERTCLIRQSRDHDVVFSYDKPDSYELAVGVKEEGYSRQWVRCKSCGFYYSVYSRDEDVLDNIYNSAYRHQDSRWRGASAEVTFLKVVMLTEAESEAKYRVKWTKENIQHIWESGLVRRNKPPYLMLDIGGSPGVFAYEFEDEQWKSFLLDPDQNTGFIREKFNIPFLSKKYEPNSFGFTFDLVCAVLAIEHLAKPIDFLESVQSGMGPDSLLCLEVPDAIVFKFQPPDADSYFNSCHLWMFTASTLVRLLEQGGFDVYNLQRTRTIRGLHTLMAFARRS